LPLRAELLGSTDGDALDGSSSGTGGSQRGEALLRRFSDISPTLLLFLQRLRVIVIREMKTATSDGSGHNSGPSAPDAGAEISEVSAGPTAAARAPSGADNTSSAGIAVGAGAASGGRVTVMRRVHLAPHLVSLQWGSTGTEHSSQ
jgi:hypothetical protein